MTNYGMFSGIVSNAGALIATTSAIALGFKGRAKFEPSDEDIPRGPQKVAALTAAVLIAIIWATFRRSEDVSTLKYMALGGVFCSIAALCIYGYLISTMTYYREVVSKKSVVIKENIIGGFKLTKEASRRIKEGTLTQQQFFKGVAYDVDLVWTRSSRALAKLFFVLSYIGLTAFGTLSLAIAAILIDLVNLES